MTSQAPIQKQNLTDEEHKTALAFDRPAMKDTIVAHLMRAAAVLPVRGGKGENVNMQALFVVNDITARLQEKGVREFELFLAMDHFIENEEFFPSYAKIHRQIYGTAAPKEKDE